jgi:hypothetical protein
VVTQRVCLTQNSRKGKKKIMATSLARSINECIVVSIVSPVKPKKAKA